MFLSLISDQRIQETLKLMGKPRMRDSLQRSSSTAPSPASAASTCVGCAQRTAAAESSPPNRDVQEMVALALARAGDTTTAEKLADELDKTAPLDTLVQRNWLPVIRAAISLQRKEIELLQTASEIKLGENRLLPAYLRGEAYLMLHDGKHAAAEFQKYIDHRGTVRNSPWGAFARLGLARLCDAGR